MGGFEGGDEGGFWDVDSIATLVDKQNNNISKNANIDNSYIETSDAGYSIKAYAKINIFLKITGHKEGRYTFISRVVRVQDLYDIVSFVPCACETFTIEGCDDIPLKLNSIYKAYQALLDFTADSDISDFFYTHKVVVKKQIPFHSGLGGYSSDAAAFIRLIKEVCNLVLSTDELVKLGIKLGRDMPYFIYNYPSANVSGYGEIVEFFEEDILSLKLHTSNIKCDMTVVYQTLQKHLLKNSSLALFSGWEKVNSKSILELALDPLELNDFYAASLLAYPDLKKK